MPVQKEICVACVFLVLNSRVPYITVSYPCHPLPSLPIHAVYCSKCVALPQTRKKDLKTLTSQSIVKL